MPKQGAAILSQVEGLLEQFLAVDYDHPLKERAQGWLDEVRSGLQELRSDRSELGDPETEALGDKSPQRENRFGDNLRAARDTALRERGDSMRAKTSDEEQPDEEEERKKRKAKAYS